MCEHTVEKRLNNLNEVQVKEDILFAFYFRNQQLMILQLCTKHVFDRLSR
jgi:hypothetical protein